MPTFRLFGELASLIAETCLVHVIGPDIDVFHLLPSQRHQRMTFFEQGFDGPDILPLLVHVALGGFIHLRAVLVDVFFG